ncbi:MAG TPA: GldG family protein [Syntrophales bacterium]|nr:GldG family protein [Syntrophales bacterium]
MLKKNLRVLAAIFLIVLIMFASITLLTKLGRTLRLDLTEDRIYSLSDETQKVLSGLSHPVRLKLFYSRTETLKGLDALRAYNNYFYYIRDLLREYVSRSKGKIILEIIDPTRDSREERDALQYGLRSLPTTADDRFFFGLALATEFGQEKAIPLLAPERQRLVEYDITEMIYSATSRAKKRIGILSSVDLSQSSYSPDVLRSMGLPAETITSSRSVLEHLKSQYDVVMLAPDAESFEKLQAVVVVHPRRLTEQTLSALDRYVIGGGKLAVFQDPAFVADPAAQARGTAYAPAQHASDLNRLLAAWGCEMPPDQLAADPSLALQPPAGTDSAAAKPATALVLKGKAVNHENGLNPGVSRVGVLSAGKLQMKAVPGITATPLLQTSETGYAVRADGTMQRVAGGNETVLIGVRLTGVFSSALSGEPPPAAGAPTGSKPEAKREAAVVVFSDVDMLVNAMTAPDGATASGDGNADLVLATMENLTGSVSLASIKARGTIIRPFDAVDRLERAYDQSVAPAVANLQAEIASGQKELDSLARKAPQGEETLLKEELLRSRKMIEGKMARAREELASIHHNRKALAEKLFTIWKASIVVASPALILLVPALVFAAGLLRRIHRSGRIP